MVDGHAVADDHVRSASPTIRPSISAISTSRPRSNSAWCSRSCRTSSGRGASRRRRRGARVHRRRRCPATSASRSMRRKRRPSIAGASGRSTSIVVWTHRIVIPSASGERLAPGGGAATPLEPAGLVQAERVVRVLRVDAEVGARHASVAEEREAAGDQRPARPRWRYGRRMKTESSRPRRRSNGGSPRRRSRSGRRRRSRRRRTRRRRATGSVAGRRRSAAKRRPRRRTQPQWSRNALSSASKTARSSVPADCGRISKPSGTDGRSDLLEGRPDHDVERRTGS